MKRIEGIEGRGFSKKRMPICNGLDRGSNFASIRKNADLEHIRKVSNVRRKVITGTYYKVPIAILHIEYCKSYNVQPFLG